MRKSQARTGARPLRVGVAAAAAAAVVVAGTAVPAYAGTTLNLSPSQVSVTGGTVLYITGGTALTSALGVRFVTPTTATCPTNYNTASTGTVDGGLITALNVNTAYVTTPPMPAGAYKPCFYQNATSGGAFTTDALNTTGTISVTAVNMATVSPSTAQPAAKVTMTAESGLFTGTTYNTEFVSGVTACPSTYTTTSSSVLAATTEKVSGKSNALTITVPAITAGTPYYICTYAGVTSTSALVARAARTFTSYSTTLPALTVNPTAGSSGTVTTITVTAPSAIFSGTPDVLLTRGTCPLTYTVGGTDMEPYDATTTKISNTKLAVTVPTTVIVGGMDATTSWNVCVYASSSSGALLGAPASYTVAPVLTISGATLDVSAGPAQGGSDITISGLQGIPTAPGALVTASLGGAEITNIHVIDSHSFSGTTSAHAPGSVALAVTTAAGTRTLAAQFTYTYGITVSPNTAESGSTPVVDITGAGFSSVTTWDDTATTVATTAHGYVFLTNNAWNAAVAADGPTDFNAMDDTTPPVSYCNGVLPISDVELICTLNLTAKINSSSSNTPTITSNDVPDGTYTITVVNQGNDIDTTESSVVSSGATFTVASF